MDYKTSWLAKLFAPNSHYQHILVNSEDVVFVDGFQHHVLLIDQLQIDKIDGLLWDTLILNTATSTYQFGGLPHAVFDKIVHQIFLSKHQLKHKKLNLRLSLSDCTKQLKSASDHALQFAKVACYIRHQDAENWLNSTQPVFLILQQANQYDLLTGLEKDWYQLFTPFMANGLKYFEELNQRFVRNQIATYEVFFDRIESQPLTWSQRKACVVNEKSNLVLAGAGTGKTSTMIARAGYLVMSGLAKPDQILMLAYANKAAEEMQARVEQCLKHNQINVKTFHGLGKFIIAQVEGKVPNIHPMALDESVKAKFIDDEIKRLLTTDAYRTSLINYFFYHHMPYKSQYDFDSLGAYTRYISENEIVSLQGEQVKSYEECEIANFLFRNGIQYRYEQPYKIDTRDQNFKQYQPDFYLTEFDIYIEHFAISAEGNTPSFINQKNYLQGMEWKRNLHAQHQTKLIETYSYLKQQGRLTSYLAEQLQQSGVIFKPLAQDKLLEKLQEKSLVSELSKLIAQILSLFKLSGLTQLKIEEENHQSASVNVVQALFEPVFNAYQDVLSNTYSIDFDDMILRATQYVEDGQYRSPYLHILVDEFQDISHARASLVRALLAQQQASTLFCVGDDWQSIYRFSGSDNRLTYAFEAAFGVATTNILDKTFRFNNKINEVASRFVQHNPQQLKKEMDCHQQVLKEAVSIIKTMDTDPGLLSALSQISEFTNSQSSNVLILSRFGHAKPDLRPLQKRFPHLIINFMTVHASKGKEADFVIVIGMNKGKFGFPSGKLTHPILERLLPTSDYFLHAEERRLFYVALTRAKRHVFLLVNPHYPSDFICELVEHQYPVKLLDTNGLELEEQTFLANTPCPACTTGMLIPKDGPYGSFMGCTHHPLCDFTQTACQACGSETENRAGFLRCRNRHCDFKLPLCPACGSGVLKQRKSQAGKSFWGCSHYRKGDRFSCTYTVNQIDSSAIDFSHANVSS